MACKRSATTELNHDNWNDEEVPEEPGIFAKAPAEVLEKRVLKTAKRRITSSVTTEKSAFSSFSGFKTSGNTNTASQFSFLTNINTSSAAKPSNAINGSQNKSENNGTEAKPTGSSLFSKDTAVKKSPEKTSPKSPKKSSTYYSKLKGLNEGVSQWIKKHVDANPFCILTPIFKDYEKYLEELEKLKPDENEKTEENTSESKKSPVKAAEAPVKVPETTIFGGAKTSNDSAWKTSEKSIFSNATSNAKSIFGNSDQSKSNNLFTSADSDSNPFFKKSNPVSADDNSSKTETKTSSIFAVNAVNPATFSFGQSSVGGTASAGFSFGGGKPFTFNAQAVKPNAESNEQTEEDDKNDEDEPPKPDFKPVTEEGSIFEQRCKVYVKKDDGYKDRGVGTLFLKPTPNDKMQLIVRAVNSLGNLLLNTLLTSSLPLKRIKDNTLMIICLPMPDSEPPPVSVLLRVKTKEDCDNLFEALKKHAK